MAEVNEISLEDLEAAAEFFDRLIDQETDEQSEIQRISEGGEEITRYMIEK